MLEGGVHRKESIVGCRALLIQEDFVQRESFPHVVEYPAQALLEKARGNDGAGLVHSILRGGAFPACGRGELLPARCQLPFLADLELRHQPLQLLRHAGELLGGSRHLLRG
jgi:hypothetical protein